LLQAGPAESFLDYRIVRPGGAGTAADGSAIDTTDPLERVSTSTFTKEGLLKSVWDGGAVEVGDGPGGKVYTLEYYKPEVSP